MLSAPTDPGDSMIIVRPVREDDLDSLYDLAQKEAVPTAEWVEFMRLQLPSPRAEEAAMSPARSSRRMRSRCCRLRHRRCRRRCHYRRSRH